jgi:nanoRNase/pAp phosphatase (c-di-AMP/oligoRNAs hydrolase)
VVEEESVHADSVIPGNLIQAGQLLVRREKQLVQAMVQQAVPVEIASYPVMAANAPVLHSEVGSALAEHNLFGACFRILPDGRCRWSLRSKAPFSVLEIAQHLGGNGHPQAAGFVTDGFSDCIS